MFGHIPLATPTTLGAHFLLYRRSKVDSVVVALTCPVIIIIIPVIIKSTTRPYVFVFRRKDGHPLYAISSAQIIQYWKTHTHTHTHLSLIHI